MRRLGPLAELNKADMLTEEGPKDAPDVATAQSAERRDVGADDGPTKPKIEKPAGSSALPLLPLAILGPLASSWLTPPDASDRRKLDSKRRQRGQGPKMVSE